MERRNLIGGDWVEAGDGRTITVTNPATDEVLAEVPRCGARETRAAIAAAQAAFEPWSRRTAAERGALLRELARLMLEERERLACLMTREQGKPLAEARGEIAYAASFVDWAAEEGKRLYGDIVPASQDNKRILVLRQPVGVAACITPWNFPAAMITRKLGPALAAGCTLVVKPAEQTPLSALALGELALRAGIPPGVLNIVTGDAAPIGKALLESPVVRKLSFTGSTEVGRLLMAQAAQHLTRLSLELGGHAPFIVFEDADVEAAIHGAMASKYRNMGQTCICTNRFFVHDRVYEDFVGGLEHAVRRMRVGSGLEEGVTVGPLIDDDAVRKVQAHVSDAVERGATLRVGGELADLGSGYTKRFFQPTLVEGMTPQMLCAREETFGPVSPVARFETEEEAVRLANDSEYGLAAYFYTRDVSRLFRVAERLEYGIVSANDGSPSTAQAPFGGVKHSGFGREGGRYAMHEYVDVKYLSVGLSS